MRVFPYIGGIPETPWAVACIQLLPTTKLKNYFKAISKGLKDRIILVTIGLWIAISTKSYSQRSDSTNNSLIKRGDKHLALLVGYNFWRNHNLELGIAKSQLNFEGHHPIGYNYFLSTEVRLGNTLIIGPKVGCWAGGGSGGFGLNAIYYTDLNEGAWRLRPEIGVGLSRFKLAYGYNLTITNKRFEKVNKHNIGLNILLSLSKKNIGNK